MYIEPQIIPKDKNLKKVNTKIEIIEYIKNKQFEEWTVLLDFYISKLINDNLKDTEKNFWKIKLYTLYLQFIEIFCINIFIITEKELFNNLFINNNKLKEKIKKEMGNVNYINFLFDHFVFGIKEKNNINNLTQKKDTYKMIIKEIIDDYIQDFELLNSYKHGFRLESKGSIDVRLNKGNNTKKSYPIDKYDSSINYWSKGKKTKGKDESNIIFENRILFKWKRIVQKFNFLNNILKNSLKVFLSDGNKVILEHLYVKDKNEFNKHFGVLRIKQPLFFSKKDQ